MPRQKVTTCPRCKIREKVVAKSYCRLCQNELQVDSRKKPREYLPWPEQREVWFREAAFMLARPPGDTSERVAAKGECVARFVLPLELCKPQNRKRAPTKGAQFAEAKTRQNVFAQMRAQCSPPERPLPGRPQVLCVRFSSEEPDKYSDWAKVPVDCLCQANGRGHERLGVIVDDSPKRASIYQWWEKAKPGKGFVLIEVWTGDSRHL